jgi:UDP-glucose-4-epimerase GalE
MRVLVTGGAGYVGSVSVEALVDAGYEAVVLDDLSTGHEWADLRDSRLVRGSYGDHELIELLLREGGIEAVLHCAARSLVGESIDDPATYYRENVAGGITLLEAMRTSGVGRLVISSTAAVYGVPETTPISEDAALNPINPYGETKRTFETAAAWYSAAYGLRVVSLRYFNVAGASRRNGELHEPETHLIPNILSAASGGQLLTLFGDDYPTPDGTAIRDYVHVLDLARAHRIALEATAPDDPRTATPLVCNLGSGGGFSVAQVVATAEQVLGRAIPHAVGPRREGDPPILVAAIDRARDVLDWRPERSTLEEMIESAWSWRRSRDAASA